MIYRNLNAEIIKIVKFIQDQLQNANMKRLIIGLSGGIDSSVVAALCVKAVGKENVFGVMLPYKFSQDESLHDAKLVADKYGIKYEIVEITKMVDAYFDNFDPDADALRRGNRMARERMCVLYDFSAKYNALVAGTGNLSELMIGYCTQYGDSACAFETIGHLYKTEVFKIAEILDVPESVINKKPTADLWKGQTDEAEMGITYKELDEILYKMLENKLDYEKLILSFSKEKVDKVMKMIQRSEFKRNMPPSPK
jgi:NAD+ synthase